MTELEKRFLIFKFDEEGEKFLINSYNEDEEIFKSNKVLIIVNHFDKLIWIWQGKNSNIRMKVIATQEAPKIRDMYGIDYKISAIDEGIETERFQLFFDLI
ncbi:MAG: hypothetical protein EU533_04280 [Promethearchaeota archaeon]|nr:MAG: hypothetical protein EU533_04280 [Candidatus Lokiarchaeota archaeon]